MSPLPRAIVFFATGESDENNCRATASVARQAMRLPYKFRVNTRIR
jgi:hypothetical protein